VLSFQLGDGLVNLSSPISNTLVSCLALSGVSYLKWVKYFLPLVGIYLVIGTGFMLLAGAAGRIHGLPTPVWAAGTVR